MKKQGFRIESTTYWTCAVAVTVVVAICGASPAVGAERMVMGEYFNATW